MNWAKQTHKNNRINSTLNLVVKLSHQQTPFIKSTAVYLDNNYALIIWCECQNELITISNEAFLNWSRAVYAAVGVFGSSFFCFVIFLLSFHLICSSIQILCLFFIWNYSFIQLIQTTNKYHQKMYLWLGCNCNAGSATAAAAAHTIHRCFDSDYNLCNEYEWIKWMEL